MGKLGTNLGNIGDAAIHNYRKAEIKRLLSEGVSISKIAKMLKINYKLAKVLSSLD